MCASRHTLVTGSCTWSWSMIDSSTCKASTRRSFEVCFPPSPGNLHTIRTSRSRSVYFTCYVRVCHIRVYRPSSRGSHERKLLRSRLDEPSARSAGGVKERSEARSGAQEGWTWLGGSSRKQQGAIRLACRSSERLYLARMCRILPCRGRRALSWS